MENYEHFLIEEYKKSYDDIKHNATKAMHYFQVFIALTTASFSVSFAGMIFSYSNPDIEINQNVQIILIMTPIILLYIYGIYLIKIEIKLRKNIIYNFWQINYVRKYFLERNNSFKDYLIFEICEAPKGNKKNNLTRLKVQFINILEAFLIGIVVYFILFLLKNKLAPINNCYLHTVPVLFSLISFFCNYININNKLINIDNELKEKLKFNKQDYKKIIKETK